MTEKILIHGAGVEGRAAAAYFSDKGKGLILIDDADTHIEGVRSITLEEAKTLMPGSLYLRSPGVRPDHSLAAAARAAAKLATTPTGYWLSSLAPPGTVTITGTKGKSTTTALASMLLQNLGRTSASYGNIGRPPLGPRLPSETHPVVEVSSFMAYDLPPADHLHVITALYQDHLDWHGTLAAYHDAKLRPFRFPRPARGLASQSVIDGWQLPASVTSLETLVGFAPRTLQVGGSAIDLGADELGFSRGPLQACLAFAVGVGALFCDAGSVRDAAEKTIRDWRGLPSRQAILKTNDGRIWVDDTLATIPEATLAALHRFKNRRVILLLGGADRGQDFTALEEYLAEATSVIAIGFDPTAARIKGLSARVDSLEAALREAALRSNEGSVVLFSPAAPSSHPYKNYQERSAVFATYAGADA